MASNVTTRKVIDRLEFYVRKGSVVSDRIIELNVKGGVVLGRGIMPKLTGFMAANTKAVKLARGWGIKKGSSYYDYQDQGTVYIEGHHFSERMIESIRRGLDRDFRTFESFLK